jgi:hypothetical protein
MGLHWRIGFIKTSSQDDDIGVRPEVLRTITTVSCSPLLSFST